MDSKYTPKLHRPAAVSILDQRKLKEFRKRMRDEFDGSGQAEQDQQEYSFRL